MNWSMWNT